MPVPLVPSASNGTTTTTANGRTASSSPHSKKGGEENIFSQLPRTKLKNHVPQDPSVSFSKRFSSHMPSPANKASQPKNRKKRHSPFRIKVGSIVALRYRSKGNHVKVVLPDGTTQDASTPGGCSEVWADPMPGRDEGLALVGRRIRCFFPKSSLSDEKTSKRTLEGEVISLPDYETQWRLQRKRRRQRNPCGTRVELLVDMACLPAMPFLNRTDEIDDSKTVSEKEKKRRYYEDIIRGKDKVAVQVTLADASRISKGENKNVNELNGDAVALWAIRKRMPLVPAEIKLKMGGEKNEEASNGEKTQQGNTLALENGNQERPKKRQKIKGKKESSVSRYIGDGNDSPDQQQRNWRWLVGRNEDLQIWKGALLEASRAEGVYTLLGEVLQVTPTPDPSPSSTLATVTLRHMILPEQTKGGRRSEHGPLDIFDVNRTSSLSKISHAQYHEFQVPVEELVIVCRQFQRRTDALARGSVGETLGDLPIVQTSYSSISDTYHRRAQSNDEIDHAACHRCRRTFPEMETKSYPGIESGQISCCVSKGKLDQIILCAGCINSMEFRISEDSNGHGVLCGLGYCDCRWCLERRGVECEGVFAKVLQNARTENKRKGDSSTESASQFADASFVVKASRPVYFYLPKGFLDLSSLPIPSEKPVSKVKKRSYKVKGRAVENQKSPRSGGATRKSSKAKKLAIKDSLNPSQTSSERSSAEDEFTFKPTCCKLLPYDQESKTFVGIPKQQVTVRGHAAQHKKSVRGGGREKVRGRSTAPARSEKKTSSRAARANQRRMLKDVAQTGLGLDTLAGREQNLRFDKSLIHAWGVFADEEITAGEMIVEYRGELIENAVTEKREKEYEEAKIGSDYMFRIDGNMVCDATKQGNVARFINASCNPNCYTQIITLNGVKRIAIYAKKDINAGEELCYDYKFPLEYDESRRIKCYCGATDCRGFMNWDKKYVALPSPAGKSARPPMDKRFPES